MAIDWAATGSMLQGLATWAGALAVIYAAHKGADVFRGWRRQKLEELKIEKAERIITAAYKAKAAIEMVRGNFMPASELAAAEERLKAGGIQESTVGKDAFARYTTAQGILSRIEGKAAVWEDLDACKPFAKAYFGEVLEKQLGVLTRQVVSIQIAAQEYARDTGHDRDFSRTLRADIWKSWRAEDAIEKAVDDAVAEVEHICLPIIRAELEAADEGARRPWWQRVTWRPNSQGKQ